MKNSKSKMILIVVVLISALLFSGTVMAFMQNDGEEAEVTGPMSGTVISDDYRYLNHLGTYNGYDIFCLDCTNRFCMEIVDISEENRTAYADIINRFAQAVPDANTYNIVLPTASEFYAPIDKKSNFLSEITDIYSRLNENVTPINAVKPLSEHLSENIFFKTDHHWTQLGAYYVYSEFLSSTGDAIDPPYRFNMKRIENFQGSFLDYLSGSDGYYLMADTYDTLDLYYPCVDVEGSAYYDVGLTEYIGEVECINPSFKNYDCFMEGDYPIEVFKTGAPNDKKLCIIKESFGNAFAVWALNNYSEVYVVDYRCFNGYYDRPECSREFSISAFYETVGFDDLCIISYPISVISGQELNVLSKMAA